MRLGAIPSAGRARQRRPARLHRRRRRHSDSTKRMLLPHLSPPAALTHDSYAGASTAKPRTARATISHVQLDGGHVMATRLIEAWNRGMGAHCAEGMMTRLLVAGMLAFIAMPSCSRPSNGSSDASVEGPDGGATDAAAYQECSALAVAEAGAWKSFVELEYASTSAAGCPPPIVDGEGNALVGHGGTPPHGEYDLVTIAADGSLTTRRRGVVPAARADSLRGIESGGFYGQYIAEGRVVAARYDSDGNELGTLSFEPGEGD